MKQPQLIRTYPEIVERLRKVKIHPKESDNDCLVRLLDSYENFFPECNSSGEIIK